MSAIIPLNRAEVARMISEAASAILQPATGDAYRYNYKIETVITGIGTFTQADLDLTPNHVHDFELVGNNAMRYIGIGSRSFIAQAVVALSAGSNEEIAAAFAINGVAGPSITYLSTDSAQRVSGATLLLHCDLNPGDEVTIFVANLDSTHDITVVDCYLLVHQ